MKSGFHLIMRIEFDNVYAAEVAECSKYLISIRTLDGNSRDRGPIPPFLYLISPVATDNSQRILLTRASLGFNIGLDGPQDRHDIQEYLVIVQT